MRQLAPIAILLVVGCDRSRPSPSDVAPELAAFTISPQPLIAGVASDVQWQWSYAHTPLPDATCTIDHGIGVVASGQSSRITLELPETFTLTCTNRAGSATAATLVDTAPRQYRFSTSFSSSQGEGHFYYRQYSGSYSDMTWDATNDRWQGIDRNCLIGAGWMHPDAHEAALGWQAPAAGQVTIQSFIERPDAQGDGVRVRVVKNGAQIWPSGAWQIVAPRLVAQSSLMVDVAAGDMIYFHVDPQAEITHDTVFWDPVISYATPPKFTTDGLDLVIAPADLDAMQIPFMDASLSTVHRGAGTDNLWFHTFADSSQRFSGPLGAPAGTLLFAGATAGLFSNPHGADGRWWINNVYQHSDGSLLAFNHVEMSGPQLDRFRIGLAYSSDLGTSWTYLGHIITMAGDPPDLNITGAPFLIVDANFYVYYNDVDRPAVARAPVADVIAAAKLGNTSPWFKYYDGGWMEPGLGGMATSLGVSTSALHSDAAFSTTKDRYILTGYDHGPGRGVWIAFSSDGLTWTQGDWLVKGSPSNLTLSPYVTIVNVDGTDNALVGDQFFVYWSFTPRWDDPVCTVNAPNCGLRYVYRQLVTLVAP